MTGVPPTDVPPEVPPEVRRRRLRRPVVTIAWRRTALLGIALVAVVLGASVILGGGAAVALAFYEQYGAVRDAPNARAWAALEPQHVGQATCAACHEPEVTAQDASIHVNVACEGCHGPAAEHAASDEAARTASLVQPRSDICVTCHGEAIGRPASIATVDPATHYSGGACLRCHDPHSITASRPPVVSHPLVDLPACTTCHAPDGLKRIPTGHELVRDAVCLSCHGKLASGRR